MVKLRFNIFLLILFIILLIPSVQAASNERITDGSFEDNSAAWTIISPAARSGTIWSWDPYYGSWQVNHNNATASYISQSVDFTDVTNLVFMAKECNNPASNIYIYVDGALVDTILVAQHPVGWTSKTVNVSSYSGTKELKIKFYDSVNSYLVVDNFSMISNTNYILGYVTTSVGGAISAATISLNNSGGSTTSNDTGYYKIIGITDGTYTISAISPTHEDYSDTVSITSDTEKNITMTRLTPIINNYGVIDSSESSLRIGWHENPVVDSVKIYQGTDTNLIQTESTPYISIWSYTVDNLDSGTGYNFWLQPYDGAVAGSKYYVSGETLGGTGGGGGSVPTPPPDDTPTITPTPGPTPPPWTNYTETEWLELTRIEQQIILSEYELKEKMNLTATDTYKIKPININLWWLILLISIGTTVYGSQKENGELLFTGGIVGIVISMIKLGLF